MDMEITIKLNEQDIEELIEELFEEDNDECECDCKYTNKDMLEANEDELNWLKEFLDEHADLFRNTTNHKAILARADLLKRIHLGEGIVGDLRDNEIEILKEKLGMTCKKFLEAYDD